MLRANCSEPMPSRRPRRRDRRIGRAAREVLAARLELTAKAVKLGVAVDPAALAGQVGAEVVPIGRG